ncbi:hypothetical protein PIB30_078498 [Stylosanthes scabra]|uniref:Uncharacterized protein n=1 Tax=Stylosanthes scabra TaxID=79078 RepID=A0ABU6UQF5_9FABA|nr:hypothetical protein [Stylosanthes scabra]
MALQTYHEDTSLKLSEDIIISLNQRGYVSDFGALCRTCSTQTICPDFSHLGGTDLTAVNVERDQNTEVDSSEEDSFEEATESRGLWRKGGLFFDSSEDDEVLTRLFNCDPDRVKRATKKSKKQKQGRKPPNIQGRSLATRILLSGTKQKSR